MPAPHPPSTPERLERLQKILSAAGVASRRASEQLILDGRVSVNGATVRTLGTKADPLHDEIRVDGRRVKTGRRLRYVLVNKPAGYVSTRSDPQGRPTVLDLVPKSGGYLYPVGRLDFDTEGLLLVTNDGDLAARLTHPRHGVVKTYHAIVRGVPSPDVVLRLARGIVIDGRRTAAASVRVLERFTAGRRGERALVEFRLGEGRNRQVRLMCEAVGHPVERLKRVGIGPLSDARLRPGEWRELATNEVEALKAVSRPASATRTTRASAPREGRPRDRRRRG